MEPDRFDALTRSVASRRSFVAKVGGGGLGAALLGTLGLREEAAAATSCLLNVRLFVRVGPSAGFPLVPKQTKTGQLVGQLRLRISSKGDLAGSTFVLADGSSFPVVGSVAGHQIGLRIALAQDQTLVLQGVDVGNVVSCKGAIDGGLVGPHEGDLGDWHATVAPTNATPTATVSGSQSGVTITPIPTSSSGTIPPTDTPPAPTATNAPDTPTATPPLAPPVCAECQEPERGVVTSPGCAPVADDTPCSGGSCCGGICGDLSANPNHCGMCGNVCVSGCCQGGVCCPLCTTGQTLCGMTCVDLSSDPSNCGTCGHACASDATCTAGVCKKPVVVCPPGQRNCGGVCTKLPNCP
jgi:hypothetical protein